MKIELLWFEGCPNHEAAEAMVRDVLAQHGLHADIARIEVPDLETGNRVTFPGSPTIRVNGVDVEPGWQPCEDCTPRCRVYFTPRGFKGLPEREWVESAVLAATD
jgi:hypothetical protein